MTTATATQTWLCECSTPEVVDSDVLRCVCGRLIAADDMKHPAHRMGDPDPYVNLAVNTTIYRLRERAQAREAGVVSEAQYRRWLEDRLGRT
jgi:hypothetical protein